MALEFRSFDCSGMQSPPEIVWLLIFAAIGGAAALFFARDTSAWLGFGKQSTTFAVDHNEHDETDPIIFVNDGAVRGRVIRAATGRNAQEFLNIPFAKPPVGRLRFRPPELPDKWGNETVRDGTKLGNACVQNTGFLIDLLASAFMFTLIPSRVSEDCLNINVHTPVFPVEQKEIEKLPVMVWIHGGAFRVGSNTVQVFNGSILAAENKCIVVVLNYRLGPLGFFSLKGVEGVSGNQGMLDQALALKWTRDNIHYFGGDPNRITIMGVSAGSASVHYHLLSPLSRDLFQNAIMQSGTALSFWSYQTPEHAQQESKWFAKSASCLESDHDETEEDDNENVLECLQSKSIQDILVTSIKVLILHEHHALFNPTLDGLFIEKSPHEYLSTGDFGRANVMLGTTKYEIMPLLSFLYPFTMLLRAPAVLLSKTQFTSLLEQYGVWFHNIPVEVIKFAYRNWSEPKETGAERWRMLNEIADDVFMNNAVVEMLDAYHTHNIPIYRYRFERIASKPLWGFPFGGSVHADDAPFFMGHVLDPRNAYDKEDVELSRRILKVVDNFMRSGNPNAPAEVKETDPEAWQPYAGHLDYYSIDTESYGTVRVGPERQKFEFWHRAVPYLRRLMNNTTEPGKLDALLSNSVESSQVGSKLLKITKALRVSVNGVGMKLLWFLLPYVPL